MTLGKRKLQLESDHKLLKSMPFFSRTEPQDSTF
uniref:Uncharacterized protein n=1 Tax=Arundo donax TaxID=35708 RepID=A0A0A9B2C9_ARUDO